MKRGFSLFLVDGITLSGRPQVAERPDDGSRGLQPTVFNKSGLRRGATLEGCKTSRLSFNRRSATTFLGASDRGLKPTATFTASLREDRADANRDPLKTARGLQPAIGPILITAVALITAPLQAADQWVDISTPLSQDLTNKGVKVAWPGGCSGVVFDRLNGAVVIKVVSQGLWRSSDQGATWQRIDNDTVSGRDETGWATSVDQNDPSRMASFSLDGLAGWTTNGTNWKSFANNGRNWDFGSVDWASPAPQTILAAKHETTPPGEVDLSTDGGASWKKLSIALTGKQNAISMLGVLDATTFIYGNGHGIFRSTDTGVSWAQVSPENPQTRIPVLFKGVHYLGTTNGLLVSKNKGATWQSQGASVNIWLGPFFGASEDDMTAVGPDGVYLTQNAGKTWTRKAAARPRATGFSFAPNWFGCYAWDHLHHIIYASAMGNPVYQQKEVDCR